MDFFLFKKIDYDSKLWLMAYGKLFLKFVFIVLRANDMYSTSIGDFQRRSILSKF